MCARTVLWLTSALVLGKGVCGEPARAQGSSGFIAIAGIANGPATVLVDGQASGWLSDSEITLPVPAGSRRISVLRDGFLPFERVVDVRANDVVRLEVRLQPANVQVRQDDPVRGTAAEQKSELRLVSLEPSQLPIIYGGARIGSTPATLTLPAGKRLLVVGSIQLCLELEPNAKGFVRIRSSLVDFSEGVEVRTSRECGGHSALPSAPDVPAANTRRKRSYPASETLAGQPIFPDRDDGVWHYSNACWDAVADKPVANGVCEPTYGVVYSECPNEDLEFVTAMPVIVLTGSRGRSQDQYSELEAVRKIYLYTADPPATECMTGTYKILQLPTTDRAKAVQNWHSAKREYPRALLRILDELDPAYTKMGRLHTTWRGAPETEK
jgi:hypothetical protein